MRTYIYVDGFNLYYGSLRKTSYKWLDLKLLFQLLLKPYHDIKAIKYYTARISARSNNQASLLRQKIYLKAIQNHIKELSIYYGHHLTHSVKLPLANRIKHKRRFVDVLKSEEKGSDVNLALHLLNDAWLDNYDCAVIVSNDSDLTEAMRLVKNQHQKKIGLIVPVGQSKHRRISKELMRYADFIKEIRKGILKNSQLPEKIPGTVLKKPDSW